LYGSVGFGCGLVGQGIANLIMTAKRYVCETLSTLVPLELSILYTSNSQPAIFKLQLLSVSFPLKSRLFDPFGQLHQTNIEFLCSSELYPVTFTYQLDQF